MGDLVDSEGPDAGWYLDPDDAALFRYWDGVRWTDHRSRDDPTRERRAEGVKQSLDRWSSRRQLAPQEGSADTRLASPSSRLAAFAIDAVFAAVCGFLLYLPALGASALAPASTPERLLMVLSGALALVFPIVYPLASEGWLGQSYGKHLLRIRVMNQHSLKPIGVGPAVFRYATRFLGACILGLGVLSMLWDNQRQGWHDKLTESVVVEDDHMAIESPLRHLWRVYNAF